MKICDIDYVKYFDNSICLFCDSSDFVTGEYCSKCEVYFFMEMLDGGGFYTWQIEFASEMALLEIDKDKNHCRFYLNGRSKEISIETNLIDFRNNILPKLLLLK